jgi:acetyltransferase
MGVRRIYSLQSTSQTDALQLEREMGFTVRTNPGDPVHMLVEKIFPQP